MKFEEKFAWLVKKKYSLITVTWHMKHTTFELKQKATEQLIEFGWEDASTELASEGRCLTMIENNGSKKLLNL